MSRQVRTNRRVEVFGSEVNLQTVYRAHVVDLATDASRSRNPKGIGAVAPSALAAAPPSRPRRPRRSSAATTMLDLLGGRTPAETHVYACRALTRFERSPPPQQPYKRDLPRLTISAPPAQAAHGGV